MFANLDKMQLLFPSSLICSGTTFSNYGWILEGLSKNVKHFSDHRILTKCPPGMKGLWRIWPGSNKAGLWRGLSPLWEPFEQQICDWREKWDSKQCGLESKRTDATILPTSAGPLMILFEQSIVKLNLEVSHFKSNKMIFCFKQKFSWIKIETLPYLLSLILNII